MTLRMDTAQLMTLGISQDLAEALSAKINPILAMHSTDDAWKIISTSILHPELPFELHTAVFSLLHPHWQEQPHTAAAWLPDESETPKTNIARFMAKHNQTDLSLFHDWTTTHYDTFWKHIIHELNIAFHIPPHTMVSLEKGVEQPSWLPGAKLNIAESCFMAHPERIALISQKKGGKIERMRYGELNKLSNQIANSLIKQGFKPRDAIAIDMPMTPFAVAIYLGIIKMGGVVVSIADSFSSEEIALRLTIARAKAIFTQDVILRDHKILPLYEKIVAAHAPTAIVLSSDNTVRCSLRKDDIAWSDFLVSNDEMTAYSCDPMSPCTILFSSGTTNQPKAIPWNHTTAIKAASDAYFHQDIQHDDIITWPTNLGWMMGPWLIFAGLINQATIGLYDDVPREREFGQFIQDANVTVLGVVPTLVSSWRHTKCMEGLDWQTIKTFTSTGECSNPEDMFYLMHLAGYKPVIEYCGGTEIGGAYLTSTLIEKNCPSVFTTPAVGLDICILNDEGKVDDTGEVALIPPSIGLSTELLNADHHQTYYADMPKNHDGRILRRHGDQVIKLAERCFCVLGRADDTMNLGGIKVSSAEIERALAGLDDIQETAAIGVSPTGFGPSQLVIYAVTQRNLNSDEIKKTMQQRINSRLNPLFKISAIEFVKELPKTASNKIMRRVLRKQHINSMEKEG